MSKEALWSMSTTIRDAERILGFLKTAAELDGVPWTLENQEKFQILLIKNREYLDPNNSQSLNKLSSKQIALLKNIEEEISFDDARAIFLAKDYQDPPMRGRQSMSPLKKLGLVYIIDNMIKITDVGHKLITGAISFEDFILDALLKYQYPNPEEISYKNWNTKPFITTLHLIKAVNRLCKEREIKEKGISSIEFGIFALSLKSFKDVEKTAREILNFRAIYERIPENERNTFSNNFTMEYLAEFNNPIQNIVEYTDNISRYLRLTKYIYIRGKYSNTYIDLEPRRLAEIDEILKTDNGSARAFSIDEWRWFMGTYGSYIKPFETVEILTKIAKDILLEISSINNNLGLESITRIIPSDINDLKSFIASLRTKRSELQNLQIKRDYREDIFKIDEVIYTLLELKLRNKTKFLKRFSIELEHYTNVALNIINDSISIKPNAIVGDDNESIYTAPSGVPDIECYYENFNAICEVSMLTSRDQWYNEGQPVMRHLREFESKYECECYCLFVAPSLHEDTLETFWMSVQNGYKGKKQRIIPLTLEQLIQVLKTVKQILEKGKHFSHLMLLELFNDTLNTNKISNSTEWTDHIWRCLKSWHNRLTTR